MTVDLLWGNTTIKQETERDKSEDDIAVLPHMRAGTGTSSIASGYPAIAIQEELAGAVEGKKIKIEVTVPDLDRMELGLELSTGRGLRVESLFDKTYRKINEGGELEAVTDDAVPDLGSRISKKDGLYHISIEKSYSSGRLGDDVELIVTFDERRAVGGSHRDIFSVSFD
ncbi:hypothetical protein [Halomonas cupida]|uniref:hypothetical protein n=1 Tax=Halomonas cupida TaxID=44933 RepID=UPI003A92E2B6